MSEAPHFNTPPPLSTAEYRPFDVVTYAQWALQTTTRCHSALNTIGLLDKLEVSVFDALKLMEQIANELSAKIGPDGQQAEAQTLFGGGSAATDKLATVDKYQDIVRAFTVWDHLADTIASDYGQDIIAALEAGLKLLRDARDAIAEQLAKNRPAST